MRVFLAIDFADEIKERLLEKINLYKKSFPHYKWVKKPSLHLTIKFIGEVDDALIPRINRQLAGPLRDIKSFTLSTTKTGLFPSPAKARVFFLDLEDSDTLKSCFTVIESGLHCMGIEKEKRRFHPHITLARIKNQRLSREESGGLLREEITQMTINVDEIILMKSELMPSGARYTPVQRFSLRAT